MADRSKQQKESTPPPLLLMPASQGLTFNSPGASNVLLPVPQGEASLITSDEVGEADSFLGQSPPRIASSHFPPATTSGSFPGFPGAPQNDPFSRIQQPQSQSSPAMVPVGQSQQPTLTGYGGPPPLSGPPPSNVGPPPMFSSSGGPPTNGGPPLFSGPPPPSSQGLPPGPPQGHLPPSGPSQNYHRPSGRMVYAQPPTGTYAPTANQPPFQPPPPSNFPSSTQFSGPPPSMGAPIQPPPQSATSIDFGAGGPPLGGPPLAGPPPMSGPPSGAFPVLYSPVTHHWFFCKNVELKMVWQPFSHADSAKLEDAFRSGGVGVVSTDGGRYDVDVAERTRSAVYWDDPPSQVRRASWFYRPEGDTRFVPYEESLAEQLEEIYERTLGSGEWHRRHEFPNGDVIVMHNANVVVSFKASANVDEYGNTQGDVRPKVVKRGVDDFEDIADGEPSQVDHLVFVVHGIGVTCDLRFRNIIECVDDFRKMSLQMGRSHFGRYQDEGRIGRVEFLPVHWHQALHGDATGVDRRLKAITLKSIGKLREFTNDTLLDILFYSSPTYTQQIADTVGNELNRLYSLFMSRNPCYQGEVSVSGHSLGSLILFDLLVHQQPPGSGPTNGTCPDLVQSTGGGAVTGQSTPGTATPPTPRVGTPQLSGDADSDDDAEVTTIDGLLARLSLSDYLDKFRTEEMDLETLEMCEDSDIKELGIPLGPRKKIQGMLKKRKQKKEKRRDQESQQALAESQRPRQTTPTPTLVTPPPGPEIHNSRDPVLRSASNTSVSYMQASVGTGTPYVNYPQLSFSTANFFALGSPIAMFLTVRGIDNLGDEFSLPTCPGFFNIFHPFDPVAYRIEPLLAQVVPPKPFLMPHHMGRKRLHLELKESLSRMGSDLKHRMVSYFRNTWRTINDFALAHRHAPQEALEEEVDSVMSEMTQAEVDAMETESIVSSIQDEDVHIGSLNQGRRVDYVLQEKPIESFNDYIFALSSHLCYWDSEDTVLMFMKEIYAQMGLAPIKPGMPLGLPTSPPRYPGAPPAFPRHPMASPPTGQAPPMFTRPNAPPSGPASFGAPPSNAPPPLSGFVRK